jgi:hypothetical protein
MYDYSRLVLSGGIWYRAAMFVIIARRRIRQKHQDYLAPSFHILVWQCVAVLGRLYWDLKFPFRPLPSKVGGIALYRTPYWLPEICISPIQLNQGWCVACIPELFQRRTMFGTAFLTTDQPRSIDRFIDRLDWLCVQLCTTQIHRQQSMRKSCPRWSKGGSPGLHSHGTFQFHVMSAGTGRDLGTVMLQGRVVSRCLQEISGTLRTQLLSRPVKGWLSICCWGSQDAPPFQSRRQRLVGRTPQVGELSALKLLTAWSKEGRRRKPLYGWSKTEVHCDVNAGSGLG